MRCHIPIDSTVGVGLIKWKDEWGRTVGEWGSILREVEPILSDFRKGMIWITHFTNRRNCFAVMDHQLCEARSSSFTKKPKK